MISFNDLKTLIVHLRRKRGWTQAQLAARIGYDRGIVGNVEAGQYPPSARMLRAMEVAFELRKGDLLVFGLRRSLDRFSKKLHLTDEEMRMLVKRSYQ